MNGKRLWATLHPFFEDGSILGRNVANECFLTALLQYAPYDEYVFFLPDQGLAGQMDRRLRGLFPELTAALRCLTRHALPDFLAAERIHCAHLSDCLTDFMPLMRVRNAFSRHIFPVTGPTHSLSYARYAPIFFSQLWAGVTARDALIATSTTGRNAVLAIYAALRQNYGLDLERFPSPRVAHIPLGVNPDEFPDPQSCPSLRVAARTALGAEDTDVVLLAFARLSHYSKMDVLPLLRAIRRAQAGCGTGGGRLMLVLAGWAEQGDPLPGQFVGLARDMGIRVRLALCPDAKERRSLFAGADIFVSPVDNVQETFGLTLLEAGVSSLPVIASDFDGYRDTVLHGKTGLLVPTLGPVATPESDTLAGVWFDNQYHLQIAQQSVVDVPALAGAIAALAGDAERRRHMGEEARTRILASFTWKSVIRRHVELWDELANAPVRKPAGRHPLHPSTSTVFSGYYTTLLDERTRARRVCWTVSGQAVYRGVEGPILYAGIERLVDLERLKLLLFKARKPLPLAALLPEPCASPDLAVPDDERAAFLLLWALKQDLLEFVEQT